jgi:succinoglycan biosynthesis protein ExoW
VIPHFQQTPGVLARTLAAVFAQDVGEPLEVVIVDDSSPAPAAGELSALGTAERALIRILERRNGGPAAAKNTGLMALSDAVDFIALLDCDDLWHPQHLTRAVAAFDLGYDFYFANHQRENASESRFSQCGVRADGHRVINEALDLYAWEDDLFDTSLRNTIIGLSTVVYRRAALPKLRFNESVGIADDIYFTLQISQAVHRIAFSPHVDVLFTEADNASVVTDWRSNKSLRLILGLHLCYRRALRDFLLTEGQQAMVRHRLREYRLNFVTAALAMLRAGIRIDVAHVARFLRNDLAVVGIVPAVVATEALRWIRTALRRTG